MVESDRNNAEKIITVDELEIAVNEDITKLATMYGGIQIDYVKTIYQKGFVVKFSNGQAC